MCVWYSRHRKKNNGSFEEGQLLKACAGDNAPTQRTNPHRIGILYPFNSYFASGISLFVTLMTPCSASACTVFLFSYFIERNLYT